LTCRKLPIYLHINGNETMETATITSNLNLRLTDLEALGHAAECLRTLAHPHRLRMIQMLLQADFTVSQLAEACHLPSAMASEHLRLMQRCGLLASEKDGRKVYYRVVEPHLRNILHCIEGRFGTNGSV
jgi:ArsR family transcriptional regulator, zinc-responsive transcriptional repressor